MHSLFCQRKQQRSSEVPVKSHLLSVELGGSANVPQGTINQGGDSGGAAAPSDTLTGCLPHVTFEDRIQGGQESQRLVSREMGAEARLFEKVDGGGDIGLCSQLKQRLGYKEGDSGFKS